MQPEAAFFRPFACNGAALGLLKMEGFFLIILISCLDNFRMKIHGFSPAFFLTFFPFIKARLYHR